MTSDTPTRGCPLRAGVLVFVYGTLTDPDRARRVLGAADYEGAATLSGLHRVERA